MTLPPIEGKVASMHFNLERLHQAARKVDRRDLLYPNDRGSSWREAIANLRIALRDIENSGVLSIKIIALMQEIHQEGG